MKYVIVGAGPAAVSAAKTLAGNDSASEIVIISSEKNPFYIKPALVEFISGEVSESALFHENNIKYENVKVITGKRVNSVDSGNNKVKLSSGEEIDYNYLLVATGASSRIPSALSHARGNIDILSDCVDAMKIRKKTETAKKIVISGNGYTGVELARGLRKSNAALVYISRGKEVMPGYEGEVDNDGLCAKIKENGIELILGDEMSDVNAMSAEVLEVVTKNGKNIQCNMVISSDNYEPNVDFLNDSGISLERGIVVSEELRSSVSNIFAAGDVAQVYDINKDINKINFGWSSASAQGELCAKNILGEGSVYIADEDKYFRQLIGKKIMDRW